MNTRLPPALLLGADRLLGLQLARILWRKKVQVIGAVANPDASYCHSRALQRIVPVDDFLQDYETFLKNLSEEFGSKPVIIPCSDDWVWWINDRRERLDELTGFLIPPAETLELMADKSAFYHYAIEHNLPLSETRFVTAKDELHTAAAEMKFPLLLKPARKSSEWMRITDDFKVVKTDDADTLLNIGTRLLDITDELILQSWVRGPDANMHSLYVCLDENSQPLTECVVAKKLRQWPPDVGVGALAVQVPEENLVQTGLSLLQKLGYVGPGSFQFKQDEVDRQFYIIEMNARSPLNFPLCEACGIEATYTHYCAAAGLPLPENRTVSRPGGKWICWKTDLASAYAHWKRGDLTLRNWLQSLRGHKWSADIQFDDLRPLFGNLLRKWHQGILSPRARKAFKQ